MNNTEFEIFSKDVLQKVHALEGCEILDSWHNRDVQGLTGVHQIDGYVKIKLPGDILEIYIEAKNWANPVSKPNVMTFVAVLDDIPGSKKGLMVSRKGFDHGNIDPICKAKGIGLWTLNEVSEDGNKAHFEVEMIQEGIAPAGVWHESSCPKEDFDKAWLLDDKQVQFFSKAGSLVGTREQLYFKMAEQARTKNIPIGGTIYANFPDGHEIYLEVAGQMVRIPSISGKRERSSLGKQGNFVSLTHMLRSLTNDDRYFVDNNGKVIRSEDPIELEFDFQHGDHQLKTIIQVGLKGDDS